MRPMCTNAERRSICIINGKKKNEEKYVKYI